TKIVGVPRTLERLQIEIGTEAAIQVSGDPLRRGRVVAIRSRIVPKGNWRKRDRHSRGSGNTHGDRFLVKVGADVVEPPWRERKHLPRSHVSSSEYEIRLTGLIDLGERLSLEQLVVEQRLDRVGA